jgi:restriction system protein
MARRTRSTAGSRDKLNDLALKLMGAGLLLGLLPLLLGKSAVLAAFKPMMPLGWLLFAVGLGILIFRRARSMPQTAPPTARPSQARKSARSTPDPSMSADVIFAEMNTALGEATRRHGSAPQAPTAWGKEVFNVIEWRRFEALVEALFAQAGFETKSQSHGADEGIDIWLYSHSNPGSPVSIVQCKHWQGKKVGVDKVRELRGVMAAKNVSRGQFATTSTFTDEAVAFAKDNGVNLLDVQGLLALIAKRTQDQQTALLNVALEGEYWRPTCVSCGIKMVERSPRNGGKPFWGCKGFPTCKNTMQLRPA